MVHATQYLRYIHSPTQFHEIQTELNKSLDFSVVPDYPPLVYYQMKKLASSHFRVTNIHTDSIPGQLYAFRIHNLRTLHHTDLENRFMQGCQTIFAGWSPANPLPNPKYLERVMLKNREKSFSRSVHAPISAIGREQISPQPPPTGPNRHSAYVNIRQ